MASKNKRKQPADDSDESTGTIVAASRKPSSRPSISSLAAPTSSGAPAATSSARPPTSRPKLPSRRPSTPASDTSSVRKIPKTIEEVKRHAAGAQFRAAQSRASMSPAPKQRLSTSQIFASMLASTKATGTDENAGAVATASSPRKASATPSSSRTATKKLPPTKPLPKQVASGVESSGTAFKAKDKGKGRMQDLFAPVTDGNKPDSNYLKNASSKASTSAQTLDNIFGTSEDAPVVAKPPKKRRKKEEATTDGNTKDKARKDKSSKVLARPADEHTVQSTSREASAAAFERLLNASVSKLSLGKGIKDSQGALPAQSDCSDPKKQKKRKQKDREASRTGTLDASIARKQKSARSDSTQMDGPPVEATPAPEAQSTSIADNIGGSLSASAVPSVTTASKVSPGVEQRTHPREFKTAPIPTALQSITVDKFSTVPELNISRRQKKRLEKALKQSRDIENVSTIPTAADLKQTEDSHVTGTSKRKRQEGSTSPVAAASAGTPLPAHQDTSTHNTTISENTPKKSKKRQKTKHTAADSVTSEAPPFTQVGSTPVHRGSPPAMKGFKPVRMSSKSAPAGTNAEQILQAFLKKSRTPEEILRLGSVSESLPAVEKEATKPARVTAPSNPLSIALSVATAEEAVLNNPKRKEWKKMNKAEKKAARKEEAAAAEAKAVETESRQRQETEKATKLERKRLRGLEKSKKIAEARQAAESAAALAHSAVKAELRAQEARIAVEAAALERAEEDARLERMRIEAAAAAQAEKTKQIEGEEREIAAVKQAQKAGKAERRQLKEEKKARKAARAAKRAAQAETKQRQAEMEAVAAGQEARSDAEIYPADHDKSGLRKAESIIPKKAGSSTSRPQAEGQIESNYEDDPIQQFSEDDSVPILPARDRLMDEASDTELANFAMREYMFSDTSDWEEDRLYVTSLPIQRPSTPPRPTQKRPSSTRRHSSQRDFATEASASEEESGNVTQSQNSTRSLRKRVGGKALTATAAEKQLLGQEPREAKRHRSSRRHAKDTTDESEVEASVDSTIPAVSAQMKPTREQSTPSDPSEASDEEGASAVAREDPKTLASEQLEGEEQPTSAGESPQITALPTTSKAPLSSLPNRAIPETFLSPAVVAPSATNSKVAEQSEGKDSEGIARTEEVEQNAEDQSNLPIPALPAVTTRAKPTVGALFDLLDQESNSESEDDSHSEEGEDFLEEPIEAPKARVAGRGTLAAFANRQNTSFRKQSSSPEASSDEDDEDDEKPREEERSSLPAGPAPSRGVAISIVPPASPIKSYSASSPALMNHDLPSRVSPRKADILPNGTPLDSSSSEKMRDAEEANQIRSSPTSPASSPDVPNLTPAAQDPQGEAKQSYQSSPAEIAYRTTDAISDSEEDVAPSHIGDNLVHSSEQVSQLDRAGGSEGETEPVLHRTPVGENGPEAAILARIENEQEEDLAATSVDGPVATVRSSDTSRENESASVLAEEAASGSLHAETNGDTEPKGVALQETSAAPSPARINTAAIVKTPESSQEDTGRQQTPIADPSTAPTVLADAGRRKDSQAVQTISSVVALASLEPEMPRQASAEPASSQIPRGDILEYQPATAELKSFVSIQTKPVSGFQHVHTAFDDASPSPVKPIFSNKPIPSLTEIANAPSPVHPSYLSRSPEPPDTELQREDACEQVAETDDDESTGEAGVIASEAEVPETSNILSATDNFETSQPARLPSEQTFEEIRKLVAMSGNQDSPLDPQVASTSTLRVPNPEKTLQSDANNIEPSQTETTEALSEKDGTENEQAQHIAPPTSQAPELTVQPPSAKKASRQRTVSMSPGPIASRSPRRSPRLAPLSPSPGLGANAGGHASLYPSLDALREESIPAATLQDTQATEDSQATVDSQVDELATQPVPHSRPRFLDLATSPPPVLTGFDTQSQIDELASQPPAASPVMPLDPLPETGTSQEQDTSNSSIDEDGEQLSQSSLRLNGSITRLQADETDTPMHSPLGSGNVSDSAEIQRSLVKPSKKPLFQPETPSTPKPNDDELHAATESRTEIGQSSSQLSESQSSDMPQQPRERSSSSASPPPPFTLAASPEAEATPQPSSEGKTRNVSARGRALATYPSSNLRSGSQQHPPVSSIERIESHSQQGSVSVTKVKTNPPNMFLSSRRALLPTRPNAEPQKPRSFGPTPVSSISGTSNRAGSSSLTPRTTRTGQIASSAPPKASGPLYGGLSQQYAQRENRARKTRMSALLVAPPQSQSQNQVQNGNFSSEEDDEDEDEEQDKDVGSSQIPANRRAGSFSRASKKKPSLGSFGR